MRLRRLLASLLLLGLLTLLWLLPRSQYVLEYTFELLKSAAASAGLNLQVSSVSGNLLSGLRLGGLTITAPGLELEGDSVTASYSLLSLLSGPLTVSGELTGITGRLDPSELELDFSMALPDLPVTLGDLQVADIDIEIGDFPFEFPVLSIDGISIGGSDGVIRFGAVAGTTDGRLRLEGEFSLPDNALQVDVPSADLRIANHWWPYVTGGQAAGTVSWVDGDFAFDAFVTGGSIDFLEAEVEGIAGPVSMRDLKIMGDLAGTGLGGSVLASTTVDIASENYGGELSADPGLAEAVAWLGRNLDTDLSMLSAQGELHTVVELGGWKEVWVTGMASGSGTVAGLPLEAVNGAFTFDTETGIGVEASASLSEGAVLFSMVPAADGSADLHVSAQQVRPLPLGAPELLLAAEGTLLVAAEGASPRPGSSATAWLTGTVGDRVVSLEATGASDDLRSWSVDMSGGDGTGASLTGSGELDFTSSTVSGQLGLNGLELGAVPWPITVAATVPMGRLGFPLDALLRAEAGPLSLEPVALTADVDPDGVLSIVSPSGFDLRTGAAGTTLILGEPPLVLDLPGAEPAAVMVRGHAGVSGPVLVLDLSASTLGYELTVESGDGSVLAGLSAGNGDALLQLEPDTGRWTASGAVDLEPLGTALGLGIDGVLQGTARGTGAEVSADVTGDISVAGLALSTMLRHDGGSLLLEASTYLAGEQWRLDGSLLPELHLSAESALGSLALAGDEITGAFELDLPGQASSLSAEVAGSLSGERATVVTSAGDLHASWGSGLAVSGELRQALTLGELDALLEISLSQDGAAVAHLSTETPGAEAGLSASGSWSTGDFSLQGSLPAAAVSHLLGAAELLAGVIEVSADIHLFGGTGDLPVLAAVLSWTGADGSVLAGTIELTDYAQASGTLVGQGLSASWQDGALEVGLDGFAPAPFAPSLPAELRLSASAETGTGGALGGDFTVEVPGIARMEGVLDGSLRAPELTADASLDQALLSSAVHSLEPPGLLVTYSTAAGLGVTDGQAVIRLVDGEWRGTLPLDFELLGEPHTLRASIDGPALAPIAELGIMGPLLEASSSWLEGELTLEAVLTDPVPVVETATVTGVLQPGGTWRAHVSAAHPGIAGVSPLALGAELSGSLGELHGVANLRGGPEGARLLTLSIEAGANGLLASADLRSLDVGVLAGLLGLDAAVTATGDASLEILPGEAAIVTLDGALSGTVAGSGLELSVQGTGDALEVSGSLAGEPLRASLGFAPQPGARAEWGTYTLDVVTTDSAEGMLIEATLGSTAPDREGAVGQASLLYSGGTLAVSGLSASAAGLDIRMAGPVWPGTHLEGSVAGVDVVARWTPDGLLVNAAGSLAAAGLPQATLDLAWSPGTGFRGGLEAAGELAAGAETFGWRLVAVAQDDGALVAEGSLWREGSARDGLATARARLEPDAFAADALSGRISGIAGMADVFPGTVVSNLGLSTSLNLAGSLAAPVLSGTVAMTGAVEATGTVSAHPAGGVTVELAGPSVLLTVRNDGAGWHVAGQVEDQLLDELTEVMPGATISLRLEGVHTAAASWLSIEGLALRSRGSLVTGEARWSNGDQPGVNGELEVAIDLADTRTGLPLAGGATGRLTLEGATPETATLEGELRLAGIAVSGSPELSGSLVLSGTPADPRAALQLEALGDTGSLQGAYRPSTGSLEVSSSLSLGWLDTDIHLRADEEGLVAGGSVAVAGGTLELTATDAGTLVLNGVGDLAGWRAQLQPSPFSARVSGELAGLLDVASGSLEASLVPGQHGVRLQGRLDGVELAGVSLGDTVLASEDVFGGFTSLTGTALSARVDTSGDWQVSNLELTLPQGIRLVASGSGVLPGGEVQVAVAGAIEDQPFTANATLSASADRLSVDAEGRVLGGRFSVTAGLVDRTWQGEADFEGLDYAGISLGGTGSLHGTALSPRLELITSAEGWSLSAHGSVHASLAGVEFHQTVVGDMLAGSVTVQGALGPEPVLRVTDPDGYTFRLEERGGAPPGSPLLDRPLRASGRIGITLDSFTLSAAATPNGDSAVVSVSSGLLPGLHVEGDLDLSSLGAQLAQVADGIELHGLEEVSGRLRLDLLGAAMTLESFGVRTPVGTVTASGVLRLDGSGRMTGDIRPGDGPLSAFVSAPVPFALVSQADIIRLVSAGPAADVEAVLSLSTLRGTISMFTTLMNGNLSAQLAFDPGRGLSGLLSVTGLDVFEMSEGSKARLNGTASLDGEQLTGSAELTLGSGSASLTGAWGLADLLPPWLAPRGTVGGTADLRVGRFEVDELPFVDAFAPHLGGNLTGVLQLRNRTVVGSFVSPDLHAAGNQLSLEALVSGTLGNVNLAGSLAGSQFNLNLGTDALSGLLELRRFPFETVGEAVAGPLDVTAEVTGVVRFGMPLAQPASVSLHVATELVRLERAGQVTTGNLAMELADGRFEIRDAAFEGAGTWSASGVLTEEHLDFRLDAVEAEFGPMLGLIPALAALNVDAAGSLAVRAGGSLANPVITISSDSLDFRVAGIGYRLEDVDLGVTGNQLALTAELLATDPLQGHLSLRGGAGIALAPPALTGADFSFTGSLVVPFAGAIQAVAGTIRSGGPEPGAPLVADVTGSLGEPFRLSGGLSPLDLNLVGNGLMLDLPAVFLRQTVANADLTLRENGGGLYLGGDVLIEQGTLSFSREPGDPDQPPTGVAGAAPLGGLAEMLNFDALTVRVPARLRMTESFGSAELTGQVTVTGTLAAPLLSGRADALRGSFQFVGREFTLREASVAFDPTRGLLPALQFTAVTSFDRTRLLPQGSGLQMVAPTEGLAEVSLSFSGAVETTEAGSLSLNVDPVLTSNVTVQQVLPGGTATAARSLTSDELLSLVAFGRVEIDSLLAGDAGLATAVAQGAIETAVDMFILAELQRALSESLGIDLVEIRSGVISDILTGNQPDQFGLSLRLGGYVTDDVFATYRLSAFDDPQGLYAFSNEVGLRYSLGPVDLELAGRLSIPDQLDAPPVTELSLGLQYALSPRTSLSAGFDLSGERQQYRFGVTWRW